MDWLYLLAVQGTLKSLLQHHSSKASILLRSAFFTVQLSHPYMTTGKIITLTRQAFVGKVISLLFNMLSRLVIIYLPRSKCLLISWLQSSSAVILEPPKINSDTVSTLRELITGSIGLSPVDSPSSPPGHLYRPPPSSLLHVTVCISLVSLAVENCFTINLDVLSSMLYGWRSLEATVRIRLKARGRRLNSKT